MLELRGVDVTFDRQPALQGLDLSVRCGEFVVVLGASGCGKTTLLRVAAGLLTANAGRLGNHFRRTGLVFQEPRLLPWADALENAAFGLKALGANAEKRRRRAHDLLVEVGFSDADMAKRPAALSGGMRQRVALARALAIGPNLILLDEPFSALDYGLRWRLQDLVRAETQRCGAATLFVTHDATEAVRLATRIVVLSKRPGRVVAELQNTPETDPARAFARAAALLQEPEVAAAIL